jgi:AsmA protein
MKSLFKWAIISVIGFFGLVIAVLLIVPKFVDTQKYQPYIEKQISKVTGRDVGLGKDISLSLFPWAGLSVNDVRLGNLPGFEEKDFVSAGSFEIRFKLLPLFFREIEVNRFVLNQPKIILEKNDQGKANWQTPEKKKTPEPSGSGTDPVDLSLKSIYVEAFMIKEGIVTYIDRTADQRIDVKKINLTLTNITLDQPIDLEASAEYDGLPLSTKGTFGPVGPAIGQGEIPVDLAFKLMSLVDLNVTGKVVNPAEAPKIDLSFKVSPFSPRNLINRFGPNDLLNTRDPSAFNRLSLVATITGDSNKVAVSDGVIELDSTKALLIAEASQFDKPNIAFDINIDALELDRYLSDSPEGRASPEAKPPEASKKSSDYSALQRLTINGKIKAGRIKIADATVRDVTASITGTNGNFTIDPFFMALYQGRVNGKSTLNFRKNPVQTHLTILADTIQVNPLLRDLTEKDFLEGLFKASMDIRFSDLTPQGIIKTLNGKGDLEFTDGAIKGIDLSAMARNIETAFGSAFSGGKTDARTDFTRLHIPFVMENGVLKTKQSTLKSPVLRLIASGRADAVNQTLDILLTPKLVATIKGQGDQQQRTGLEVPIKVAGTFQAPTFRPELKSIIQQTIDSQGKIFLGIPIDQQSKNQKSSPDEPKADQEKQVSPKKQIEQLLKGFSAPN